jgi:hypothetical protein
MREDWHFSIEELNYARDPRVTAVYVPPPTDGTPYHWMVCPLCRGKRTVVSPSIDASGLTAADFRDDPDFAEEYWRGDYDIQCPRCRGRSTIVVLDT